MKIAIKPVSYSDAVSLFNGFPIDKHMVGNAFISFNEKDYYLQPKKAKYCEFECMHFKGFEILNTTFYKCKFTNVVFDFTMFINCTFIFCKFERCTFHVTSFDKCMINATFVQCLFDDEYTKKNTYQCHIRKSKIECALFDYCIGTRLKIRKCKICAFNVDHSLFHELELSRSRIIDRIAFFEDPKIVLKNYNSKGKVEFSLSIADVQNTGTTKDLEVNYDKNVSMYDMNS